VYFDPLLYADQAAERLARVFVHIQRLHDDDAALHLSLDHVDLCRASAVQRCQSQEHRGPMRYQVAIDAPLSLSKGEPVARLCSRLDRRAEVVHAHAKQPDRPLSRLGFSQEVVGSPDQI
jgi:hypothetical protein